MPNPKRKAVNEGCNLKINALKSLNSDQILSPTRASGLDVGGPCSQQCLSDRCQDGGHASLIVTNK